MVRPHSAHFIFSPKLNITFTKKLLVCTVYFEDIFGLWGYYGDMSPKYTLRIRKFMLPYFQNIFAKIQRRSVFLTIGMERTDLNFRNYRFSKKKNCACNTLVITWKTDMTFFSSTTWFSIYRSAKSSILNLYISFCA